MYLAACKYRGGAILSLLLLRAGTMWTVGSPRSFASACMLLLGASLLHSCEAKMPCPPGHERMTGYGLCAACPKGTFNTAGVGHCTSCAAGQFATGGAFICEACSPGRFGTGASKDEMCSGPCSLGRYGMHCELELHRTLSYLRSNPPGKGGSKSNSCSGACPPGRFGGQGSTDEHCSGNCKAGRYSGPGLDACLFCARGQVRPSHPIPC